MSAETNTPMAGTPPHGVDIRATLARMKAAAEDAPYGNEELERYRRATDPTTILALIAAVEAVMGENARLTSALDLLRLAVDAHCALCVSQPDWLLRDKSAMAAAILDYAPPAPEGAK